MCSPISITEFMSCVLMIVVMLYSWVISWIRLSISTDVIGSSPEFGSSQNRYFGFSTMARAIATRLIIPPLISAGYRWFTSPRLTRFRQKFTRSRFSLMLIVVNRSSGSRTFSSTFDESSSAPPWKIMPTSSRIALRSLNGSRLKQTSL